MIYLVFKATNENIIQKAFTSLDEAERYMNTKMKEFPYDSYYAVSVPLEEGERT